MTRPMIFGVYGFAADQYFVCEPVASFFTARDAASFIHDPEQGFVKRNLYIDAGHYDLRLEGCRPEDNSRAQYDAWLESLAPVHRDISPDNGRERIAA